jgi:hypothetical protein
MFHWSAQMTVIILVMTVIILVKVQTSGEGTSCNSLPVASSHRGLRYFGWRVKGYQCTALRGQPWMLHWQNLLGYLSKQIMHHACLSLVISALLSKERVGGRWFLMMWRNSWFCDTCFIGDWQMKQNQPFLFFTKETVEESDTYFWPLNPLTVNSIVQLSLLSPRPSDSSCKTSFNYCEWRLRSHLGTSSLLDIRAGLEI